MIHSQLHTPFTAQRFMETLVNPNVSNCIEFQRCAGIRRVTVSRSKLSALIALVLGRYILPKLGRGLTAPALFIEVAE